MNQRQQLYHRPDQNSCPYNVSNREDHPADWILPFACSNGPIFFWPKLYFLKKAKRFCSYSREPIRQINRQSQKLYAKNQITMEENIQISSNT